jgi:hypothetical protein
MISKPIGATCLSVGCCVNETALSKINSSSLYKKKAKDEGKDLIDLIFGV